MSSLELPTSNVIRPRIDHESVGFHVVVVQFLGGKGERHFLRFAGLQVYPLKPPQFLDRASDGAFHIVHVKLCDLIAFALANVANIQADIHAAARGNAAGGQTQLAILEAGVAQPVAEREQRLGLEIHVT